MKIMIDAGHGGADPGAVFAGVREKDITLAIAKQVGTHLTKMGHQVFYSRMRDTDVPMGKRADLCSLYKADYFLSIHVNAATNDSAQGFEAFTCSLLRDKLSEADRLGKSILCALKEACPDRKFRPLQSPLVAKRANFYVLRATPCPAVLVECLFLTNFNDRKYLRDDKNIAKIAKAIAIGVHQRIKHRLEK